LDDADQASFGLTSRWIDNNSGREVVTLSAGQIFYFDDRKVGNPASTSNSLIAAEAQYQPIDNLWLTATTLWDSRNDKVDEGGFSFHYSADNDAIVNLGYRFRRDGTTIAGFGSRNVEQGDFSVVYPIADSWRVLGRYQYDLDTQRSLEEMVGIEYGDCCWMTRLIYQKAADDEVADGMGGTRLENDYTFILEFQLKGLGNLGSSASGLLKESILGFEDRD
jgi:LPS-assembly protein